MEQSNHPDVEFLSFLLISIIHSLLSIAPQRYISTVKIERWKVLSLRLAQLTVRYVSLLLNSDSRPTKSNVSFGNATASLRTCAGHSHDQFLMKREATTRRQTGIQIHTQHAVLLVPLQILCILRSYVRAAMRQVRSREKKKTCRFSFLPSFFFSPGFLVLRTCLSLARPTRPLYVV